jgi:hypothetical protein
VGHSGEDNFCYVTSAQGGLGKHNLDKRGYRGRTTILKGWETAEIAKEEATAEVSPLDFCGLFFSSWINRIIVLSITINLLL